MNLWFLSLAVRRWLIFGLALSFAVAVSAVLNPRLWRGEIGGLDLVAGALYLLLLFTGGFNLLLYIFGFLLGLKVSTRTASEGDHGSRGLSPYRLDDGRRPATARTAIVMPIYHEDPARVHAGVRQTWMSVRKAGARCDFYLLSDSTDPKICAEEDQIYEKLLREFANDNESSEGSGCDSFAARQGSGPEFQDIAAASSVEPGNQFSSSSRREEALTKISELRTSNSEFNQSLLTLAPTRFGHTVAQARTSALRCEQGRRDVRPVLGRIFLVRRKDRTNYKAGNIVKFLENHGGAYHFMLVLDADSVMLGETVKRMILRMHASPNLSLLQSTIIPVGAVTPFARAMQYSLTRGMPLFARGLYWFMGRESVYWGHNALIRIAPFMAHANLPIMPGKPPLGGPIMSQDIVESALLGRAGWALEWDVESGGSFDELPANILAYGRRDRRWCQGNFQHFWLIFGDQMKLGHRLYFANGILAYLVGPLLIGLMFLGFIRSIGTETPQSGGVLDVRFLLLLVAMLALPRILGLVRLFGLVNDSDRRFTPAATMCGGWAREALSATLELMLSIVIAPLLFYLHSRFVIEILTGRMVEWRSQSRNPAEGLSWSEASQAFWPATLIGSIGLIWAIFAIPHMAVCLAPVLVMWIVSIPVAVLTSSPKIGSGLITLGLFRDCLTEGVTQTPDQPVLAR